MQRPLQHQASETACNISKLLIKIPLSVAVGVFLYVVVFPSITTTYLYIEGLCIQFQLLSHLMPEGVKHDLQHGGIIETGMVLSHKQYPYRLAKLRTFGNDLAKRWLIEYYAFSVPLQKLLRKQVFISKKYTTAGERKAWAEPVMAEINRQLVMGYCFAGAEDMPLSYSVAEYLEWKKRQVKRFSDYSSLFNNFFLPHYPPGKRLSSFTRAEILAFLDAAQLEHNWSNRTYNIRKGRLYGFFRYFCEKGLLTENPAEGIRDKRVMVEPKFLPFSDSDMQYIREKLQAYDPELYLYVHFVYFCFIRPNELRYLKVADVNLERGHIRIKANVAKNGRSGQVQIAPVFAEMLRESGRLQHPGGMYFFGRDGHPSPRPYGYNTMRNRCRKFLDELGYTVEYSLYSFKHTGCCRLYLLTKDLKLVSRQCRHQNTNETDLYLRSLGVYADDKDLQGFD